jgi:hypothetical protein
VDEGDPSPVTTTQPFEETPATCATVARCARPVEEYLRRLSERGGTRAAPALALRPVDAFLLHQVAAMLPSPPDVIDLAADATGGASTALWAAHPGVRTVWAPRRAEEAPWRERFVDLIRTGGGAVGEAFPAASHRPRVHLDGPLFVPPGDWAALADAVGRSAPVLALVAGADGADAAGLLTAAFAEFPACLALVAGVGLVGGDGALEALLAFRKGHPDYRVAALREVSPFLAHSDLAAVYRGDQPAAGDVLRRVAQAFDGNFGFLNLVQAVASAALGEGEEDGGAAGAKRAARPARAPEQDYARLVERVRSAVRDAVPAGASVLVVSKGDEGLLKLDGLRAGHFPQTVRGEYAGHHPADDAAAVAHLDALRAKGAQYLVIPATSVWWLEHYDGFRRHLEQTAAVTVCRPDTCIVFSLAGERAALRPVKPTVPYPELVGRVRRAVAEDVPEGATVAVVSKGDSELVDLPGRRGVHFPQGADGGYAGHHPADPADAILRLDAARGRGAQYLLFPATAFWWLGHYAEFRRHLDEHYRLLRDDETCLLYDLGGRGGVEARGPWRARAARLIDDWARRLRGR